MSWQFISEHPNGLLTPRERIILFLNRRINEDGFIATTIENAAKRTQTPYSTAQKVFKVLQQQGYIFKLRNGLYVPTIPIADKNEKEISKIKNENKIFFDSTVIFFKKKKLLCPLNIQKQKNHQKFYISEN